MKKQITLAYLENLVREQEKKDELARYNKKVYVKNDENKNDIFQN
jgi:hypothetical protein